MTVTDPFAKPTAIWERSCRAAKAEIWYVLERDQVCQGLRGVRAGPNRKLLLGIGYRQRRQAARQIRLLHKLVKSPKFQDWRTTQVLLLDNVSKPANSSLIN
jgi:hypothetical protein